MTYIVYVIATLLILRTAYSHPINEIIEDSPYIEDQLELNNPYAENSGNLRFPYANELEKSLNKDDPKQLNDKEVSEDESDEFSALAENATIKLKATIEQSELYGKVKNPSESIMYSIYLGEPNIDCDDDCVYESADEYRAEDEHDISDGFLVVSESENIPHSSKNEIVKEDKVSKVVSSLKNSVAKSMGYNSFKKYSPAFRKYILSQYYIKKGKKYDGNIAENAGFKESNVNPKSSTEKSKSSFFSNFSWKKSQSGFFSKGDNEDEPIIDDFSEEEELIGELLDNDELLNEILDNDELVYEILNGEDAEDEVSHDGIPFENELYGDLIKEILKPFETNRENNFDLDVSEGSSGYKSSGESILDFIEEFNSVNDKDMFTTKSKGKKSDYTDSQMTSRGVNNESTNDINYLYDTMIMNANGDDVLSQSSVYDSEEEEEEDDEVDEEDEKVSLERFKNYLEASSKKGLGSEEEEKEDEKEDDVDVDEEDEKVSLESFKNYLEASSKKGLNSYKKQDDTSNNDIVDESNEKKIDTALDNDQKIRNIIQNSLDRDYSNDVLGNVYGQPLYQNFKLNNDHNRKLSAMPSMLGIPLHLKLKALESKTGESKLKDQVKDDEFLSYLLKSHFLTGKLNNFDEARHLHRSDVE